MISKSLIKYTFFLLLSCLALSFDLTEQPEFVSFRLNGGTYTLSEKITPRPLEPSDEDPELLAIEAEEESSRLFEEQNWVQIVRQDDRWLPNYGLALGFSFDPKVDTFPYHPEKVAIQFKDFLFGGQHFSRRDTANFSGLYNDYSADVKFEVIDFQSDTIVGKFSGVLISGSGKMAYLEDGAFRVRLFRE